MIARLRGRAGRWPALCTAAALVAAAPQAPVRVAGRVVDAAGQGAARVPVTVHGLTSSGEVRVGADTTGADGSFEVRLDLPGPREDAEVWVTATYGGVRYSAPRLRGLEEPVPPVRVAVYDTAVHTAAPEALRVPIRRLFVRPSGPFRAEVLDAIELSNPSGRTWVAAAGSSVWSLPLPPGAEGGHPADASPFAAAARVVGDTLEVVGPLLPGHNQVLVRYFLPAEVRALPVPLGAPTDELELLIAESLAGQGVSGLRGRGSMQIDRETFRRFVASDLAAGDAVRFSLGASPLAGRLAHVLPALLFLAIVAAAALWRRRGGDLARPATPE